MACCFIDALPTAAKKYRDEDGKKHKAIYDADKGIAVDKKGNQVHNKYVDAVVSSLNYIKPGDAKDIIKAVANDKRTVTIKNYSGEMGQEQYKKGFLGIGRTIMYNPQSALQLTDNVLVPDLFRPGVVTETHRPNGKGQTPAMGLYHEIGHVFDNFFHVKTPGSGGSYDNPKDQNVIVNYEQPASGILGEPLRYNHSGVPYPSIGPTSTIPVFAFPFGLIL